MRELLLVAGFALLLPCDGTTQTWFSSTAKRVSTHFAIDSLAPGVWAVIHADSGSASANAGIVDLGDETLVFDTFMTPEAAVDLERVTRELLGRPVRYVALSHWHNDHVRGVQVFKGATILATMRTRALIEQREPPERRAEMRGVAERLVRASDQLRTETDPRRRSERLFWFSYYDAMNRSHPQLELILPTLTFDAKLELHGKSRSVQLLEIDGHTDGDAILWVPDARVAFMGDMLFVRHHAYLPHGDALQHRRSMDTVMALHPRVVVPGHGPASDSTALRAQADYLDWFIRTGSQLAARGATEAESRANPMPEQFRDWWFGNFWGINNWIMNQRAARR